MATKRQKGAYYLKKTIDLLKNKGYDITKLETNKMTMIKGRPVWIHTDAFASDLLAMNEQEICFIQVKFLSDETFHIAKYKEEFEKWKWCPCVKRQLYLWSPKKPPRIINF